MRSASSSVVPGRRGDQSVGGHRLAQRAVEVALELQVAVRDDPDQRPSPFTIGTPEIVKRVISATASRSVASGESVIGLRIIPLSMRLTRSTSAACRSIDMFLWSNADAARARHGDGHVASR
jgi:hypothetical protein